MLAQLLRLLILGQVLVGAGFGYLLFVRSGHGYWSVGAMAVAFPFLTMVLVDVVTATQSRPNESSAHWWRSLFGEISAGFKVFLFRQPWVTTPPALLPATAGTPSVPVVLVHGYLCNHRIWDDMAVALRANGHPVLAVTFSRT